MLLRFLLLFQYVRDLVAQTEDYKVQVEGYISLVQELQASLTQCRAEIAQARRDLEHAHTDVEYWKAKSESWEQEYKAANADGIHSREVTADFVSQLRFGVKIYDKAPTLPEKRPEDFKPILKQRVQARAKVQEAERQFAQDLAAYAKRRATPPDVGISGDYSDVNSAGPEPKVQ